MPIEVRTARRRWLVCFYLMTAVVLTAVVLPAAPQVYISNCCNYPSVVTVFNALTGAQTGQFEVGTGAFDAVFTPDGTFAYVSNNVSTTVSVVRVSNQSVVATIPIGYSVEQMVIAPDGKHVFVASFDAANLGHLVSIDTASNAVVNTLILDGPASSMAVSPDGKKLYTNDYDSGALITIDTQSFTVIATLPIYAGISVALTPDGKFAYVPNFGQPSNYTPNVAVVDTGTNTIVNSIPLNKNLDPSFVSIAPNGALAYVGQFPLNQFFRPTIAVIRISNNRIVDSISLPQDASPGKIAFSPDSSRAYVVDDTNSAIDVVTVAQAKVTTVIPTLGSSRGLALSPDGTILLAPNLGSARTSVIDSASGAVVASISVGDMGPSYLSFGGAAISSDGKRAYVTNFTSGNVSVIDTASKSVVTNVPTGSFGAVGVVLKPDGSAGYAANQYANTVTVFDTRTFATTRINMPLHGYPTSLAITPDGKFVYVTVSNIVPDFGQAICYVFVIDTSTNNVVHTIIVPYPEGIAISPDGSTAYVVSVGGRSGNSNLLTISTASNRITATLSLEFGYATDPTTVGIVVTPDGTRIFADDAMSNNVWEVDTTKNKVIKGIPVGNTPGQLAISGDGSQVWAADYGATSTSEIDVASGTVVKTVPLGNTSYGIALTPQ